MIKEKPAATSNAGAARSKTLVMMAFAFGRWKFKSRPEKLACFLTKQLSSAPGALPVRLS
jgi:hypothetical protein